MSIAKNEDWVVPFVYGTTSEDGLTFTPIDLTGSEIKLEIRKHEPDHEAVVSVSSPDDGIIFNDAAGGEFTVVIVRDKLIRLAPGEYVADMVRLMTSGYQERLWEGSVTVVEGTTRP
jgi:hypothetical protein